MKNTNLSTLYFFRKGLTSPNFTRDLRSRVEEIGVRISLVEYRRYRAKMVGVSGGFGKGMF